MGVVWLQKKQRCYTEWVSAVQQWLTSTCNLAEACQHNVVVNLNPHFA